MWRPRHPSIPGGGARDGDCKISASELVDVLSELGHPASDAEIREMMAEADFDGDGFIDLSEFMELNT
ncbi:Calcium-binding protein CML24 [Acorus calamus]|uniref:Calcium-binding protein CML24 n=1 Tax=Acorus calamus TaxID=4465 RepID=A0AAV9C4M1_ACOCL|nr:Calcium-binding protein CML24 [Acorus calamus]